MSKVTQKGQVTIPQNIRDKFSFHPGTEVQFQIRKNSVILLKGQEGNKFLEWLGKGERGKKQDIDRMVDRLRGRSDE
jgi:AbrB family looped-hinge helix DNA binding protein